MSDPIERHSHISITRQTPVGIVHADMHITSVEISGMPGDMGDDLVGDCFDPDSCCDEHEKAMIAALRSCPETRFRLGPLSRSSASRIKRACIIKRNNKITNGSARLSLGQTRCRLL